MMSHRPYWLFATIALALLTALGCTTRSEGPAAPAASGSTETHQAEIDAQLAKLAPEDRQRATAQKVCPISEEPLGTMGVPVKVTVDGQDLFICCAGCEDELKQNFAVHLEKYGANQTNPK